MRSKITSLIIFAVAAASYLFATVASARYMPRPLAILAIVVLAAASIGIRRWPRLSYSVALASGLLVLHWLWRTERPDLPQVNSWIALNAPSNPVYVVGGLMRIGLAVTALTLGLSSAIRLLPSGWIVRKTPVRERTWPAILTCLLIIALWYAVSVTPYRLPPQFAEVVQPELTILHVEKNGVQFHETTFSSQRGGRLYSWHNDRRLFQYRFTANTGSGSVTRETQARVRDLIGSGRLNQLHTPPAVPLQSWSANGWYVRSRDGILAFTTEYGTEPPKEITELFKEFESVTLREEKPWPKADVCLGFCYDPVAGLGLDDLNDRCYADRRGTYCK